MELSTKKFGRTKDGKEVAQFTIRNSQGLSISAISYGATLTSVTVPDRKGVMKNIILGFDNIGDYETKSPFFGALVGRFANRIGRGKFQIDGVPYQVACNDVYGAAGAGVANHLHGGHVGYDKVVWDAEGFREGDAAGIRWSYLSRDGEEGYPGNLRIQAAYALDEKGELAFEYRAETDKPTPVNLTNHAYWNMAGAGSGDILGQEVMMSCPSYLVVDEELIPTGEIRSVKGTPFDFTRSKPVGKDLGRVPESYDHCWCTESRGPEMKLIAGAVDPESGRAMEVSTTKPSVQFYIGHFMDAIPGPGGLVYRKYGAFTFETQYYPDCVNHLNFTDSILRPGQTYHHRTVHRFYTV